jgi:hypothetical protein
MRKMNIRIKITIIDKPMKNIVALSIKTPNNTNNIEPIQQINKTFEGRILILFVLLFLFTIIRVLRLYCICN